MPLRVLTALPVFNEESHLTHVLDRVTQHSSDVLVVDDGSSDRTPEILAEYIASRIEPEGSGQALNRRANVVSVRHPVNLGYGAGLRTAFQYALKHAFEVLVTIDCDGQHEPERIPELVEAIGDIYDADPIDIVSGSRYLKHFDGDSLPPEERRRINHTVTRMINGRLGFQLTDGFCGFKAYRVPSLGKLEITDLGYAMPLQVWVQAAAHKFRIVEFPVPLIYLDEKRSFGGSLDDAAIRLAHYTKVFEDEFARSFPTCAVADCAE